MTLTPGHFPDEQRSVLRTVALAYRRAYRAGASQGECCDAAMQEYRRVYPDAPADQLAASHEVNRMVAAAINADAKWFWRVLLDRCDNDALGLGTLIEKGR